MSQGKSYLCSIPLSKEDITARIEEYDYLEISDIKNFIKGVKPKELDDCGYIYIRCKIGKCLMNHDDKSQFFFPLRELASELDAVSYATFKKIFY